MLRSPGLMVLVSLVVVIIGRTDLSSPTENEQLGEKHMVPHCPILLQKEYPQITKIPGHRGQAWMGS